MAKEGEPLNVNLLLGIGGVIAVGVIANGLWDKIAGGPTVRPGQQLLSEELEGGGAQITVPPTLTPQAAQILADRVFAAIYAGAGEDEEEVIAAMLPPRNDADVMLIVQKYGVRSGPWWSPVEYTLPGAIRAFLSPQDVARINLVYARAGINVRL